MERMKGATKRRVNPQRSADCFFPEEPDYLDAQFRKCMPGWSKQLQMLPVCMSIDQVSKSKRQLCMKTWCALGRSPAGKRGVGCVMCAEGQRMLSAGNSVQSKLAKTVKAYAHYDIGCLKLTNLKRHQSCPGHIACAAHYLGIDYTPGLDAQGASNFCPNKDDFLKVWDEVSKGIATSEGIKGLCAKIKMRQMTWCIAEAMRSKDREFVSTQMAGALMRDDGHGRMHIRYCSTNKALQSRTFMLGQMRTCASGTGADAKTKNTDELFRKFAKAGTPPGTDAHPPGEIISAVYEKMRTTLHQVTFDSASNERLSGEMMRRGLALDQARVFAPNVRMITRDKTHGSRRVITRTLAADPVLNSIIERWVTGGKDTRSVASVIDSSDEIRDKFRRFAEKDLAHIGSQVWRLGWAPHRYESMAKPLGRMIHCIYAVIQTAEWVIEHRGDDRGQSGVMIDWLRQFSVEEYLTAAMVCDAAHENIDLIRFTEPEDIDVAKIHGAVATFRHRIRFLFGAEEGCRKVPCFTQFALGAIARVCSFRVKNDVRSFGLQGDVPERLWRTCISRFQPWLIMAEKIIDVEFPSFDVVRSFAIFARICTETEAGEDSEKKQAIQRLAKVFQQCPQQLSSEFARVEPYARSVWQESRCDPGEAWAEAVRRLTHGRIPKNFAGSQLSTLSQILVEERTYCSTTSGVERGSYMPFWFKHSCKPNLPACHTNLPSIHPGPNRPPPTHPPMCSRTHTHPMRSAAQHVCTL